MSNDNEARGGGVSDEGDVPVHGEAALAELEGEVVEEATVSNGVVEIETRAGTYKLQGLRDEVTVTLWETDSGNRGDCDDV